MADPLARTIVRAWLAVCLCTPGAASAHEPGAHHDDEDQEDHAADHTHRVTRLPRLAHRVEPAYPESLRARRLEGTVVLRLTVDENGKVALADVIQSAGPELDAAARDAALQLVFEPAEVDGAPSPIQIDYRMLFVIKDAPPDATEAAAAPVAPPEAPPAFRGRILDEDTRVPMRGVPVHLKTTGASARSVLTGEDGTFAFKEVPAGTHHVEVRVRGYQPLLTTETVEPGTSLQVTYVLAPALSGRFETVVRSTRVQREVLRIPSSASEGRVTGDRIRYRPLLRPGEIMEVVPGLIISQHSGDGKANQYFVRGINLDHGTDFAITVAGAPVNMPSHGHGQGYSDVNFLVPELVQNVDYRKGPYFADLGDFSSAGATDIGYVNRVPGPMVSLRAGLWDRRVLAAASPELGPGNVLGAVELFSSDGPWQQRSDYRKVNGVLRYGVGDVDNGFSITGMIYQGRWNATDQIPRRAIHNGTIDRFGLVDDTDGGHAHRYSLTAEWARTTTSSSTRARAFLVDSGLDLFSNFTYFLEDPVNGDQFEQLDLRTLGGGSLSHRMRLTTAILDVEAAGGMQLRSDFIHDVALFHTARRERLSTTRRDRVMQTSVAPWLEGTIRLFRLFRAVAGMRTDFYHFLVVSDRPENSGNRTALLTSPKLTFAFGPVAGTELFLNAGYGFHSNDARGTTIRVDPTTGTPLEPVDPLVRMLGLEAGARTTIIPRTLMTVSVWSLQSQQELLFIGDAGTTQASRPARRVGLEWNAVATPFDWLLLDADLTLTNARFLDDDPSGERIPGALERVFTVGATVHGLLGMFGAVRLRHFGGRPLVEDNSVRSRSSTLVNMQLGYEFKNRWRLGAEVFNVFNARVSDIDYFYRSRLKHEGADGHDDVHTHPAEPVNVRMTLTGVFDFL